MVLIVLPILRHFGYEQAFTHKEAPEKLTTFRDLIYKVYYTFYYCLKFAYNFYLIQRYQISEPSFFNITKHTELLFQN